MTVRIYIGNRYNEYQSPVLSTGWEALTVNSKLAFISACLNSCIIGDIAEADFSNTGITPRTNVSQSNLRYVFKITFLEKMLNDTDLQADLGDNWPQVFSNRTNYHKKKPLLAHVQLQKLSSFYKWLEAVPTDTLSLTDEDGNDLLMSAIQNKQYPEALTIAKKLTSQQLAHTNQKGESAYLLALKAKELDLIAAMEGKVPAEGFDLVTESDSSVLIEAYKQDPKRALELLNFLPADPQSMKGSAGVTLLKQVLKKGDAKMVEAILPLLSQDALWTAAGADGVSHLTPYFSQWLNQVSSNPTAAEFGSFGMRFAVTLFLENRGLFQQLIEKVGTDIIIDPQAVRSSFLSTLPYGNYKLKPEDKDFLDQIPQHQYDAFLPFVPYMSNNEFANYVIRRSSDEAIATSKANGGLGERGYTPLMAILGRSERASKVASDFPGFALISRTPPAELKVKNQDNESVWDLARLMRDKSVLHAVNDRINGYDEPAQRNIDQIIIAVDLKPPTVPSLDGMKKAVEASIKSGRISDARSVGGELLQAVAQISDHAANMARDNFEKSERVREVITQIQTTLMEGHAAIESARNNPEKLLPAKSFIDRVIRLIPGLDQAKALTRALDTMGSSPQEVIDSAFDIIKLQEDIEDYYPELDQALLQLEEFLLDSIKEIEAVEATTTDQAQKMRLPDLKLYFGELAERIALDRVNVFNLATAARTVVRSEVKVIGAMHQARSAMTAISTNVSATLSIAGAKLAQSGRETSESILAEQLNAAARRLQSSAQELEADTADFLKAQQDLVALPAPDEMAANGVPLDLDDEDGEEETVLVPIGNPGMEQSAQPS